MLQRNSTGHCDERIMDVQELGLCDYFNGKRKNNKPCCKNCTHFDLEINKKINIDQVSDDSNGN